MNFVTILEYNCKNDSVSVSNPTWEAVKDTILALNGEDRDSVILANEDQQYMGISGGNEGRYVVGGFKDGFGSFLAGCGKDDTGVLDVVVSGDFNPYPSPNVVDLGVAIELARIFFESGLLAENGRWVSQ
jgi:hypothetical protein